MGRRPEWGDRRKACSKRWNLVAMLPAKRAGGLKHNREEKLEAPGFSRGEEVTNRKLSLIKH
jgi:hypothetical protein